MADSKEAATFENDKDLTQKRIATAVKFLQNPRVRTTAMEHRRAFLEKKGLSKEEIDEAVEKSGTAADEHVPAPSSVTPYQGFPNQSIVAAPVPYYTWRGYIGAAIIGGSLGYIIVKIFKKFILPLFNDNGSKEQRLQRIENSVTELSNGILETVGGVQTTLDSVQNLLLEQQKKIICLSADLSSTQEKVAMLPTEVFSVGDLKSEIVSLKGLLLNRRQFPSPLTGSTPAGIPSWQKAVTVEVESHTTSSPSTSFAASRKKDGGKTTDTGTGHPKMNEMEMQTQEHRTMNGEVQTSPRSSDSPKSTPNKSQERSRTSSGSSDTDTPKTVKEVSLNEKNLDDALLAETGDSSVLSNDTSVSSLSDMSANASFNEASIAFSSTCIKVPAEASKADDLANESVRDSVE